jgi:hypothetical protein
MIGGALIAWITLGIVIILIFRDGVGIVWGAILGLPLGALFGFIFGIRRESKDSSEKRTRPATLTGVWDREFDG